MDPNIEQFKPTTSNHSDGKVSSNLPSYLPPWYWAAAQSTPSTSAPVSRGNNGSKSVEPIDDIPRYATCDTHIEPNAKGYQLPGNTGRSTNAVCSPYCPNNDIFPSRRENDPFRQHKRLTAILKGTASIQSRFGEDFRGRCSDQRLDPDQTEDSDVTTTEDIDSNGRHIPTDHSEL